MLDRIGLNMYGRMHEVWLVGYVGAEWSLMIKNCCMKHTKTQLKSEDEKDLRCCVVDGVTISPWS